MKISFVQPTQGGTAGALCLTILGIGVAPVFGVQPGLGLNGAPGVIRTPDLLVRSQTLYPTELRALA